MRYIYKFPGTRAFYETLRSFDSIEEMHELLDAGLEFLVLRVVKIEPVYLVPGVNGLLARLEKLSE